MFFPVLEGVRQDSVLSGLLYLIFINDLICEIEKCNQNIGIYSINCGAPALADDISCIATSPLSLQRMLDVCSEYSRNWRFCFNANKSSIMQFSINTRENNVNSTGVLEIRIFHYLTTIHI